MRLTLKKFLNFSGFALLLSANVWALPADDFQQRSTNASMAPWGAGVFYHLAQTKGGLGLRTDLGFQLSGALSQDRSSAAVLHVQSDSIVVGYSQMTTPIFESVPLRWTLGVDLNSPFSYLGEGQLFFPMGNFEPYIGARLQYTGFSVEGSDASLYEAGASARFWLASASLGAGYSLHPDLRIAASLVYRNAFGSTKFRDAGVFHFSLHWLWGDRAQQ